MSLMILQTIRSERPGKSHMCLEASELPALTKGPETLMLSITLGGGRPVS